MTLPDDIYSQRILELAAAIPRTARLARPHATATAHSKLCGSTVTIDLAMEGDVVTDYGQSVKACLLGQSAASVMGREIVGSSASELRAVGAAMRKMLKQGGPPPHGKWADLAVLEPVRDYQARATPRRCSCSTRSRTRLRQIEAKRGGGRSALIRKSMSEFAQPERRSERAARRPRIAKALLLAPIALYRWTLSPLLGVNCRHLPTCSDYAREAIDRNGAWKGGWLALSRLCRCHPWGSHGYDPVPDLERRASPASRPGATGGGACLGDSTRRNPARTLAFERPLTCAGTQE